MLVFLRRAGRDVGSIIELTVYPFMINVFAAAKNKKSKICYILMSYNHFNMVVSREGLYCSKEPPVQIRPGYLQETIDTSDWKPTCNCLEYCFIHFTTATSLNKRRGWCR